MASTGRLLLRLILIPIAYFIAIVLAVLIISTVAMVRAYGPVADDAALLGMTGMVIATDAAVLTWVLGGAAFLPTMIAVALGEAFSIRGWIYYLVAAVAVAAAVDYKLAPEALPALPQDAMTGVAAALMAGFGYWIVAGRGAGLRVARSTPAA
jgi:hypothetical protein